MSPTHPSLLAPDGTHHGCERNLVSDHILHLAEHLRASKSPLNYLRQLECHSLSLILRFLLPLLYLKIAPLPLELLIL